MPFVKNGCDGEDMFKDSIDPNKKPFSRELLMILLSQSILQDDLEKFYGRLCQKLMSVLWA